MGFTIASNQAHHPEQNEARIIAPQTGYLEVSFPSSYSLTTGS